MDVLEKSEAMLEKHPLCDHCLGRQFAFLGQGMDNQERGRYIKTILTMEGHKLSLSGNPKGVALLKLLSTKGSCEMADAILHKMKRRTHPEEECFLCQGLFNNLAPLVDRISKALQDYEYDTFLMGIKVPAGIEEEEDEFKAEMEVQYSEGIRNELSRLIGKMISQSMGKIVDFMKPQIAVLVNPFTEEINLQVNSVFIMGTYRKYARGIPQSKWTCSYCRGKGCPKCNGTGKTYSESVEDLVAKPTLQKTLGEAASFHGAGREDTDARMLGRGRPFIIEIKKPRKREIDLKALREIINEKAEGKIKVSGLRFVDKDAVRRIKQAESGEKMYRVLVRFDREISDDDIQRLEETLTNTVVMQQTPSRVLHRRADRTREKHIYETKIKRLSQNSAEMRIRCQGGLYIKELVTGDVGRTDPNVSKIVNSKAEPLELDVLNVSMKGGMA